MTKNMVQAALPPSNVKDLFTHLDQDATPEPDDAHRLVRALRINLNTRVECGNEPETGWRIMRHVYAYVSGDMDDLAFLRRNDGILTAQVQQLTTVVERWNGTEWTETLLTWNGTQYAEVQ